MLESFLSSLGKYGSNKRISIFCGAGISFDSGLPLARGLLKKICSVLDLKDEETEILLKSNLPFESFIESIYRETSIDGILDTFELGNPNSHQILYCKLLKCGFFNSICTTNFDLLFERALANEGLKEGENFDRYFSERDFRNFYWDSHRPKLIKLHGCISDRDEIGITLDIIAGSETSIHRNQLVKEFFSKKYNDIVIVIGYSCSDIFDISPQIESVEGERSEIIFIEHDQDIANYSVEKLINLEGNNPFKNHPGFQVKINALHFCELLWESALEDNFQIFQSATDWEKLIENWIIKLIEGHNIGVKYHIPARLFYNICEYERSLRFCELGKQTAQQLGDFTAFYSEMGNAGMALNALGRFDEALEYLKNSILGCRMVSNDQGILAQSQVLGHVYRNLRDYNSSIKWYQEALKTALLIGHSFSICTSIGNLCSIYNHIGHTEYSIQLINFGLDLAKKSGNIQSESAMTCHLGIAYFQIGKISDSRILMLSSLQMAQTIGNTRSEAMIYINLANLEMNSEERNLALDYGNRALQIALDLNLNDITMKANTILLLLGSKA